MTRPRVLVLSFSELLEDPRVRRHALALAHEFEVTTCTYGGGLPGISHITLAGDPPHLPLTPVGLGELLVGANRRASRSTPAIRAADVALAGRRFDLVLANDDRCLPTAFELAGAPPVVADMHEYSPAQHQTDWRWQLMVRRYATWLCDTYLPRAARIVTVSQGLADAYGRRYGRQVDVVWNAAEYRDARPRPTSDVIRCVTAGAANPDRHIEDVIEAAAGVNEVSLDLYLVPVARHPAYHERLRTMAEGTPNVRVLDPVPMDALVSTLADYDVGVSYFRPATMNTRFGLGNKFFQFVQARLAVLVGPSPDMSRLVVDLGIGPVTPEFSVAALRRTLRDMDPAAVDRWKAAADDAAIRVSGETQDEVRRTIVRETLRQHREDQG